jgi:O-acetyl-ADP-ribose deacetylase (regulator of RNase III)
MVTVRMGDITKLRIVDAIASAANGIGVARAGVAGAITRAAGEDLCSDGLNYESHIRKVASQKDGWYDEGDVFVTESGSLVNTGVKAVLHAVTMKYPGGPTSYDIVEKCLHNLCTTAISHGYKAIAVPGLGTGIGNLNPTMVAKSTIQIAHKFTSRLDVIVIDIDPVFVEAAQKYLSQLDPALAA